MYLMLCKGRRMKLENTLIIVADLGELKAYNIEEHEGKLHAYEIKWNPKTKVKFPKTFTNTYLNSETQVIIPENIEEFISVSD